MAATLTPLLRETILAMGAKRTALKKECQQIETIIIGNSHADFGFNPAYCNRSFNLGSRSQDLKFSHLLYKHIVSVCPKLKNVVLFYSLFSPGNHLEKSPGENDIAPALNELFGLGLTFDDPKLKTLQEGIKGQLDELNIDADGISGFYADLFKVFAAGANTATRVEKHLRLNTNPTQHSHLEDLLNETRRNGHQTLIVISPGRGDYKKAVMAATPNPYGALFRLLENFPETHLLNMFDSDVFSDGDFGDCDHLLPNGKGTERLSRMIAEKTGAAGED